MKKLLIPSMTTVGGGLANILIVLEKWLILELVNYPFDIYTWFKYQFRDIIDFLISPYMTFTFLNLYHLKFSLSLILFAAGALSGLLIGLGINKILLRKKNDSLSPGLILFVLGFGLWVSSWFTFFYLAIMTLFLAM